MFNLPPPLGLYIHLPWCERKCPYCDFNSYQADEVPQQAYVDALLRDLEQDLPLVWGRSVESIFIGGGTPSLFSAAAIERLFSGLRALLNFAPAIEITLESNPGSADAENFQGYFTSGVNRLSIGVQSFDDGQLATLGRVHTAAQARSAFATARDAGFENINLDLMFALPGQSIAAANDDLRQALELAPEHISRYQLTIEPNTLFHARPPNDLPDDDQSWEQQQSGVSLLEDNGYRQYEVSAYSRDGFPSRHNLNYWHFGDYIGIGAGAHGKITLAGENRVIRRVRQRQPRTYLEQAGTAACWQASEIDADNLVFEFMLNALRLKGGFESRLFRDNTGLSLNALLPGLNRARDKGLVDYDGQKIKPTKLGFAHLNDLQALFLPADRPGKRLNFDADIEIMHN